MQRSVHFAQSCSVCWSALWGSISFGRGECEGCQVSTNATLSPSETVNEEQVLNCWPHVLTGGSLRSHTESGPATATRWPCDLRTHGTTEPKSKRSRSTELMSTVPLTPSTIRIRSGALSRCGMKSTTFTVPVRVSQYVSRTSESFTYARRVQTSEGPVPWGAMRQWPFSSVPSRAAKQAPESKRGRQSQSTEPFLPMSAAVWRSPIRA